MSVKKSDIEAGGKCNGFSCRRPAERDILGAGTVRCRAFRHDYPMNTRGFLLIDPVFTRCLFPQERPK